MKRKVAGEERMTVGKVKDRERESGHSHEIFTIFCNLSLACLRPFPFPWAANGLAKGWGRD